MSTPIQNEAGQIEARAKAFGQRLVNEPAIHQQVRENPVDALATAGLLEQAAGEFLQKYSQALGDAEVTGYKEDDNPAWMPDSGELELSYTEADGFSATYTFTWQF